MSRYLIFQRQTEWWASPLYKGVQAREVRCYRKGYPCSVHVNVIAGGVPFIIPCSSATLTLAMMSLIDGKGYYFGGLTRPPSEPTTACCLQ